jgi:NAD(P)-dependent dehydrogenase (short-subunit alcohol dehydrogenase family)
LTSCRPQLFREVKTISLATYSLAKAVSALRQLAAARHIGKVVTSTAGKGRHDGSTPRGQWIITGGLGALGALCADHLVKHDVYYPLLLGRVARLPDDDHALRAVLTSGQSIAHITLKTCDVAFASDVASLIGTDGPEIQGILHAGGVLSDATIVKQSASSMRQVMAPKTCGADNLLRCYGSSGHPVRVVKLFSSVAGLLGSGGQANYAAANALLDSTAQQLQMAVSFYFH